jgi:hypothetical protein
MPLPPAAKWGIRYIEISARSKSNLDLAFGTIIQLVMESRRPVRSEGSCCLVNPLFFKGHAYHHSEIGADENEYAIARVGGQWDNDHNEDDDDHKEEDEGTGVKW